MRVEKTDIFDEWFKNLKDKRGKIKIQTRIKKIEVENYFGDCKPVGDKIFELRINFGPGYRIYFVNDGETIIILLCGGDKSTQQKDIEKAKTINKERS